MDRLTRSVAFLSKLLEANVDVRFADLPSIEGPTGRFMLQQRASVAELEAGMISDRTKKALAAAKERGRKLGGIRRRVISVDERGKKTYGAQVLNISSKTRAMAVAALQERAVSRAAEYRPHRQTASGSRENESEGHCRGLERCGHSNCSRRRMVCGSGDADIGAP